VEKTKQKTPIQILENVMDKAAKMDAAEVTNKETDVIN
jgi:hypothetical protein